MDMEATSHVTINSLNLSFSTDGSLLSFARTLVLIFILCRALAGRWAKKTRHVLPGFLNGLKTVDTSVMNRVIMLNRKPSKDVSVADAGACPVANTVYVVKLGTPYKMSAETGDRRLAFLFRLGASAF